MTEEKSVGKHNVDRRKYLTGLTAVGLGIGGLAHFSSIASAQQNPANGSGVEYGFVPYGDSESIEYVLTLDSLFFGGDGAEIVNVEFRQTVYDSDFVLEGFPSTPFTIEPGDEVPYTITFAPERREGIPCEQGDVLVITYVPQSGPLAGNEFEYGFRVNGRSGAEGDVVCPAPDEDQPQVETVTTTCESITIATVNISEDETLNATVGFEDGSEEVYQPTVEANGLTELSLPGNRNPIHLTVAYDGITLFDAPILAEDGPCADTTECPDIDVKYVFEDCEWRPESGDPTDLEVVGDENSATICAEFPFAVDYTAVGGEEFTVPAVFDEDEQEYCAVLGDECAEICWFRVYCPEKQDCSELCVGIIPEAEFVDGEWVVEQDEEYITVGGDDQEVTICAGEDLNCILRLFVRGLGECATFALSCDECVTVTADDLGADLQTISTIPPTQGGTGECRLLNGDNGLPPTTGDGDEPPEPPGSGAGGS